MKKILAKGLLFKSLKQFVLENYGQEEFDKLLSSISEEARKIINGPLMDAASYHGSLFLEVNRKICKIFGKGKPEFAKKLGAFSARKSIKGPFKFILRLASIPWTLKRGEMIYKMYYPYMGELKMEKIDDEKNEATVAIKNLPFKDPYFEYRIAGWIEEIGRILGSEKTRIEIVKSLAKGDEKVEYYLVW